MLISLTDHLRHTSSSLFLSNFRYFLLFFILGSRCSTLESYINLHALSPDLASTGCGVRIAAPTCWKQGFPLDLLVNSSWELCEWMTALSICLHLGVHGRDLDHGFPLGE